MFGGQAPGAVWLNRKRETEPHPKNEPAPGDRNRARSQVKQNTTREETDRVNALSSGETRNRSGLLLLNLGTPDDPGPAAVGRYLREFLMDKWVLDIPWVLRWFLVTIVIVPKRKYASSEAYRTIWTERGSPLRFHLEDLASGVRQVLGSGFQVEIAMRYGRPSITSALRRFQKADVERVTVLPLYPQYAESSTRSSVDECRRLARAINFMGNMEFIESFYQHPEFIESWLEKIGPLWREKKPDHVLMTFHGLPERHIKRTDRSPAGQRHCLQNSECCARITAANRDCYRAQCHATARAIAGGLGLKPAQYTVSFQSRLGRTPWIRPFTDEVIPELARNGVKDLLVLCPSFAADCLETIEEMGDRGARLFHESGGSRFRLLSCLNSDPRWALAVARIAAGHSSETGRNRPTP